MNDGRAFCKHCHYELTGLAHNVCPECGKHFSPERRHSFTRYPRLRRWQRRVAFYLLAMAVTYIGSYYCLVQAAWFTSGANRMWFARVSMNSEVIVCEVTLTYRVGGEFASFVYSPIHALDRKLRPGTWYVTIQRQPTPLESAGICSNLTIRFS